jgi:hypothetical protein
MPFGWDEGCLYDKLYLSDKPHKVLILLSSSFSILLTASRRGRPLGPLGCLKDPTDPPSQNSALLLQSTYHGKQLNNHFNSFNLKSIFLILIHFYNVFLKYERCRVQEQYSKRVLLKIKLSSFISSLGQNKFSIHCIQVLFSQLAKFMNLCLSVYLSIYTYSHVDISRDGYIDTDTDIESIFLST